MWRMKDESRAENGRLAVRRTGRKRSQWRLEHHAGHEVEVVWHLSRSLDAQSRKSTTWD